MKKLLVLSLAIVATTALGQAKMNPYKAAFLKAVKPIISSMNDKTCPATGKISFADTPKNIRLITETLISSGFGQNPQVPLGFISMNGSFFFLPNDTMKKICMQFS